MGKNPKYQLSNLNIFYKKVHIVQIVQEVDKSYSRSLTLIFNELINNGQAILLLFDIQYIAAFNLAKLYNQDIYWKWVDMSVLL